MAESLKPYDSPHTGEDMDLGISRALPGGEIDKTHVVKTYSALDQIGLSAGIETMKAIAQALSDNSQITYSAAGGNDVADGSAYPVSSGAAITAGTLFAHRVNANQVFFEFSTASGVWVGFWSGSWSGWAQIYDARNKPTAADVDALALDGSNEMGADVVVRKSTYPSLRLIADASGRGGVIQQTSTNLLIRHYDVYGDNSNYRSLMIGDGSDLNAVIRFAVAKDGVIKYYNLLHTGNLAEVGGGSYSGLVMLKTLTVEADDVNELEFQLTAAELSKYKRFVIIPKLEGEYESNYSNYLLLEAPTYSGEPTLDLGTSYGYCSNGVALIAVGTENSAYGWSLHMMALRPYTADDDNAEFGHVVTGRSTSSYQHPTTDPLTFRLYTSSNSPFIKGGTVSIMGVN
ncbi:MAG: hypothetical protein IJ396_07720 [Oscillibacter sp.]|nr:hypothetical protein [Oscillibacter sp.]MBQ7778784.1 hypothetical protein [Oscillibacter sp.]